MKKVSYLLCIVFLLTHCRLFSQISDIDNANVSLLIFYVPKADYQTNKVKEVRVYYEILPNKRALTERSFYNKEGYLTCQENYNTESPKNKEAIKINKEKDNFIVTRELNKNSLLNTNFYPEHFWKMWYYPLRQYWENDPDSIIRVTSTYSFLKDSSLSYKTFINGKKIDTGYIITDLTLRDLDSPDNKHKVSKTDTTFHGDTMVVINKERITKDFCLITTKYFLGNLIIRSSETSHFTNGIAYSSFILYKYNKNAKLQSEEYYGIDSNFFKRKIFDYKDDNNDFVIIEEIYRIGKRLTNTNKYDKWGKKLEEYVHRADSVIKTIYKYLPNGLLDEKYILSDNDIKTRYSFVYSYY